MKTGATVTSQQLLAIIEEGAAGRGRQAAASRRTAPAADAAAAAAPRLPPDPPRPAGRRQDRARRPPRAAGEGHRSGQVAGTGRDGRVRRKTSSSQPRQPAPASTAAPLLPAGGARRATRADDAHARRIAERLMQSKKTTAMLTSFNEVNLSAVMAMRKELARTFEKANGIKLGFMSFFVKAAADALHAFPVVNASVDGNDVVYHGYADISIAVSTDKGLVTPVLRNVDRMSFADIEGAIAEFARKARDGKLALEDLQGGTFTITNGGTFGSLMSTPIVNPPQSGDPRHARDQGARRSSRTARSSPADDVHRADLRPPHHRRQGRGAVPGRHQEPARESAPDAAGHVTARRPAQAVATFRIKGRRAMSEQQQFDVVVIGAGPAGYHAAIRAAQLGLKTACIDAALGKDGKPRSAAPASRGLHSVEGAARFIRQFYNLGHTVRRHGISAENAKIDVATMIGRKDKIVKQFTGGIADAVQGQQGHAVLRLRPAAAGQRRQGQAARRQRGRALKATNVIIAAGSIRSSCRSRSSTSSIVDNVGALDFDGRAQAPGRDRRRRDRPGARQRVEAPRHRGHDPRSAAGFPRRRRRRVAKDAAREFKKQGLDIKLGAKVSKTEVKQGRRRTSPTPTSKGEQTHRRRQAAGRGRPSRRDQGPAGRRHRREARPIAASSKSTSTATPASTASGRSATACAARCSRTRVSRKASRWPS